MKVIHLLHGQGYGEIGNQTLDSHGQDLPDFHIPYLNTPIMCKAKSRLQSVQVQLSDRFHEVGQKTGGKRLYFQWITVFYITSCRAPPNDSGVCNLWCRKPCQASSIDSSAYLIRLLRHVLDSFLRETILLNLSFFLSDLHWI